MRKTEQKVAKIAKIRSMIDRIMADRIIYKNQEDNGHTHDSVSSVVKSFKFFLCSLRSFAAFCWTAFQRLFPEQKIAKSAKIRSRSTKSKLLSEFSGKDKNFTGVNRVNRVGKSRISGLYFSLFWLCSLFSLFAPVQNLLNLFFVLCAPSRPSVEHCPFPRLDFPGF